MLCRQFVMGRVCWYVYCTFLLFWCFGGGGVHGSVVQLLPIQGVACRGLAIKGWNHGVSGEVGVASVIGLYIWFGLFRYCTMAQATLSLSKEPWVGLCFHSLSSSRFLLRVLLGHWIGSMQLRIVSASRTMFEGILGICWR